MFGIVQKRAYRIEQVNKPKPWDFCTEWNENEIFVCVFDWNTSHARRRQNPFFQMHEKVNISHIPHT